MAANFGRKIAAGYRAAPRQVTSFQEKRETKRSSHSHLEARAHPKEQTGTINSYWHSITPYSNLFLPTKTKSI